MCPHPLRGVEWIAVHEVSRERMRVKRSQASLLGECLCFDGITLACFEHDALLISFLERGHRLVRGRVKHEARFMIGYSSLIRPDPHQVASRALCRLGLG